MYISILQISYILSCFPFLKVSIKIVTLVNPATDADKFSTINSIIDSIGEFCWNLSHRGIHVELVKVKSSRHVILLLDGLTIKEELSIVLGLVVLSAGSSS